MWRVLSCFCVRHFNQFKMWFVFSFAIHSRLRLCPVTFHLQNVESGRNMKQHTAAPLTHGCQLRVCEHLQSKTSTKMCLNLCIEFKQETSSKTVL